jgi:hypothetical protein
MKVMLAVAGFVVMSAAFAAPAHAQIGPTLNNASGLSSSGSLNSEGSWTSSSHTPDLPSVSFRGTSARGTEYIPSTYVPYDKALAEGREIRMEKPKTIAEVAVENRGVARPKARILVVGDARGLAIKPL